MSVANLSDVQAKEVIALFRYFDTDRDGMLSPRSAAKLCERLGFHLEPPMVAGDPGSTKVSLVDLLSWCDAYCGKCMKNEELKLAQRFALLAACDTFATGQRITRDALAQFLQLEQHTVRPEAIDALLNDLGTDGQLSKQQLQALVGGRRSGGARRGSRKR